MNDNSPWIESPFFYEILSQKNISDFQKNLAINLHEHGYAIIPQLISSELIEALLEDINTKGFNDSFPKPDIHHNEVRVQDLWQYSDSVKNLACYPSIIEALEFLYGREVVPFQTLNFRVGSQQRAHSDTMHFSSLPARFMCGVWVALEDIDENNGPLFYYPGSHKTKEFTFADINQSLEDTTYSNYTDYENFMEKAMESMGFEKKYFHAKKGDALIWSSNIVHGGSAVLNPERTRYSQVTHYFFKDCIYYTPMLSNMVTHELFLRRFLKNIRTGETVEHSYNGNNTQFLRTRNTLYTINNHIKLPKVMRYIAEKLNKF